MTIFQWTKDLETGIELIDQQHRKIVETFNSFFIRRKLGHENSLVMDCLRFLEQYVLYHFQAEEAYQVECNFPLYRSHQAMHKGLAAQVKILEVRLKGSDFAPDVMLAFHDFLYQWLWEHLRVDDRAFADYYKAYKAGVAAAQASADATPPQ